MFGQVIVLLMALQSRSRCQSEFVLAAWDLLRAARYGQDSVERAAFAVRDSDGHVQFARWPVAFRHNQADFSGTVPLRTYAIVHTHPNNDPSPSDNDAAVAKRLRMPVYVLTRTSISLTDGHRIKLVLLGDWNPQQCRIR
jgi:JAB domain-containing protein similar to deubiquitination enzymes